MSGLLNLETALGSLGGNAATSPVTLGAFVFTGVEVPSLLAVGGEQGLVIHRLVGGDRVIQSMGDDQSNLTYGGLFTGPGALARAQTLEQMRNSGSQMEFGVSGVSLQVKIQAFEYVVQQQGAVCPYRLTLVIQPTIAPGLNTSPSALSALVGPDIASAIRTVAQVTTTAVAQAQTIIGQITPLASIVGAGSLLAGVSDKLTAAAALSGAGINFAAAPAAAASTIADLQSAGASLNTTLSQAGANLTGLSGTASAGDLVANTASLQAAIGNAGAASAAATAGGYLNRAVINTQLAAGTTPTAAVVHS